MTVRFILGNELLISDNAAAGSTMKASELLAINGSLKIAVPGGAFRLT